MAAPIIATPARSRSTSDFKILAAAVVFALAAIVSLIAIQVWAPASVDTRSSAPSQYGAGYPQHGGLAGPARVSVFEVYGHGVGYPLHGGLAGPSRVGQAATTATAPLSAVDVTVHYGTGYPLHGGLAGPSRAEEGR